MNAQDMVGRTYKHFKGSVYKVVGVHSMQHHYSGVPNQDGVIVVRYIRMQTPDGGWDSSNEEFLRPLEDWEDKVWWPTAGKALKRFMPILEALKAEALI